MAESFQSHYFLGRFLGLATIARDPKTWQVMPEPVVEILLQIADEHDAADQLKNLTTEKENSTNGNDTAAA